MLRKMQKMVVGLTALALSSVAPNAMAVADWQQTLGELWKETKTQTGELTKGLKESFNPKAPVEIGIAFGTEKQKWLEWAVAEFAKTPEGKKVKVNLIPMGSVEGAEAVLKKDKRIHVWSPASSVVQELLVEPWQKENNKDPILSDAPLVLTPMVIVMWEDRAKAFLAKYNEVSFKTISEALAEQTGWTAIANKADWGTFTFGYTKPTHSNSGLLALVLMAYDYVGATRNLKAEQVMDANFLTWFKATQENMSAEGDSTGKLMDEMMRFGPSKLNAALVYENLALSGLQTAEGRWGKLKVVYPARSVWNDNPYYVLDVPWSGTEQQSAAKLFQAFLLSKPAQKVARDQFLFRPANLELPIMEAGSSFDKLKDVVQIDVNTIKRPSAAVLNQLLQVWKKNDK
jgi:ABC-type Fe3+ transport system substrate-binding protein